MRLQESWLNLNGVIYSLAQLRTGTFKNTNTTFDHSTLNFCHAWLNNKQEFQLHTSGSTGIAKPITITRQQMEASAWLTIKALSLKPSFVSLVCLDTKYIAGQMMLVRSLVLGINIIAVEPTSNPFEKVPSTQSIDFAAFVPYQIQTIVNSSSRNRLEDLKCAIIGGAPLELTTKKELQLFSCAFYATYGMTETISHVALQRLNGEQPQDFFEALDDIELEKDERGCLVIQASYVSDKKIITNDLVEIISEKKFRWLGRWDNIINSGGIKISPEKVELAVQEIFDSLKLSNRFFITGFPDEKLGQKVTLVIEGVGFTEDIKLKLERNIKVRISSYEQPKEMLFIKNFKRTETGKVMRTETMHLIPASSQKKES